MFPRCCIDTGDFIGVYVMVYHISHVSLHMRPQITYCVIFSHFYDNLVNLLYDITRKG